MIGASPSLFSTSASSIDNQKTTSCSLSSSLAMVSTPETPTPSYPASSSSSFTSPPSYRENGIPIVLMYGDRDWMDVRARYAAKAKIEDEKARILKNASE
jgi:cardiolipin-specific phospholipase